MDDTLHKLVQRLDAGELIAAIAADAHAALDRAEALVLAGNAAEARRVVAAFLHDVEFKPAVGVRENGNVSLLDHPSLAAMVGNSRTGSSPLVELHGLRIVVENAAGSERTGTTKDGQRWSVTMPCDYGYICSADEVGARTGADGDGVDCFVGLWPSETVYVVDQKDLATGEFDEHKCMLDFKSQADALRYYVASYSDGKGRERMLGVKAMPVDDFKRWLASAGTKRQAANAARYEDRPDLAHEESVRRHSERIFRLALQEQFDQAERDAALALRRKKRDEDEEALLWALVASPAFLAGLPSQLRNAASAAYQWSAQALALPPEAGLPALGQAPSAFEQLKAAKAHADSREPLYRKAADGVRRRLADSITRGVAGGEDPRALGRRFREALEREARDEGRLLGETESQVVYGVTQSAALAAAGFTHKRWVTVGDERVRDSHTGCEAQGAIPAESPFANGLMYPGDPNGPASEVVNCRCHLEGARAVGNEGVHVSGYFRQTEHGPVAVAAYDQSRVSSRGPEELKKSLSSIFQSKVAGARYKIHQLDEHAEREFNDPKRYIYHVSHADSPGKVEQLDHSQFHAAMDQKLKAPVAGRALNMAEVKARREVSYEEAVNTMTSRVIGRAKLTQANAQRLDNSIKQSLAIFHPKSLRAIVRNTNVVKLVERVQDEKKYGNVSESAAAFYSPRKKAVVLGSYANSPTVAAHEFAHAVDRAGIGMCGKISESDRWRAAVAVDQIMEGKSGLRHYATTNLHESFAVAVEVCASQGWDALRRAAPHCAAYLKKAKVVS